MDKRIERMQRKVEGSPNVESMLSAVRDLRKEREKVKELQSQKTEQRTTIGKLKWQISKKYLSSYNSKKYFFVFELILTMVLFYLQHILINESLA